MTKKAQTPSAVAWGIIARQIPVCMESVTVPDDVRDKLHRAIARALKAAEERGYKRGWQEAIGAHLRATRYEEVG